MIGRRLRTGATLVVLAVVLCVMAVWGYRAATAPIEDTGSDATSTTPTCKPEDQKVSRFLTRGEVTVSVYNSGKRAGRAQETMTLFEHAGFKPGAVGNAPDGVDADRAAVYTTKSDDPAAELVAKALGKSTQVVHSDDELGPGVDVVIGDRFKRLDPAAPRRIELPDAEVSCD
jgi:LytR cell envelope-related transcriptional attenuator